MPPSKLTWTRRILVIVLLSVTSAVLAQTPAGNEVDRATRLVIQPSSATAAAMTATLPPVTATKDASALAANGF